MDIYSPIIKGNTNSDGEITATKFIKSGGTSAQFLMADGSVSITSGTASSVLVTDNSVATGTYYPTWSSGNNIYTSQSKLYWTPSTGAFGATKFVKIGGTSAQFLMADGSVSTSSFTHPSYTARSITATGAQVLSTFTSDSIGSVTGISTRTLTSANIGASPITTAKGQLVTYSTIPELLSLGTSGQVLTVNTGTSTGLQWATPTGGSVPYTSWVGVMSQTGTAAPVISAVLENSIGAIVWSRAAAGVYRATLSGAFTQNKVALFITNGSATLNKEVFMRWSASNIVEVVCLDPSQGYVGADTVLSGASVQIRVYP